MEYTKRNYEKRIESSALYRKKEESRSLEIIRSKFISQKNHAEKNREIEMESG